MATQRFCGVNPPKKDNKRRVLKREEDGDQERVKAVWTVTKAAEL